MVQIRIYLGNELSLSSTTSCLYPHKEDLFIELDHIKLYCVIVTSIGNYFESWCDINFAGKVIFLQEWERYDRS